MYERRICDVELAVIYKGMEERSMSRFDLKPYVGKRYDGGQIVFVKKTRNGQSAQIIHSEIPVQVLGFPSDFTNPSRPNLGVIKEQKIMLSFTVQVNVAGTGLIAKNIWLMSKKSDN